MSKPSFHLVFVLLLFAQAAARQTAPQPLTPDQLGSRFVEAINAADMLRFCKALKTNQLVSAESLKLMTTDWTVGTKDAQPYGLGLILEQHAQEPTYGHGGTAGGVNFEFRYFPRMDIAQLVFNNQNNGAYDDLKRNALKLISGAR
jgi:hypothetical protein